MKPDLYNFTYCPGNTGQRQPQIDVLEEKMLEKRFGKMDKSARRTSQPRNSRKSLAAAPGTAA